MPLIYGTTNRARPAAVADSVNSTSRHGRYGERLVLPMGRELHGLADEGAIFKALTPTPGTGLTSAIQTSFLANGAGAGLFMLYNGEAAGGLQYYMEYLRLIVATAPASATRVEMLVAIDNVNRFSATGTAITGIKNVNMDSALASSALVYGGAINFTAESASVRRLSRFQIRTQVPIQFEEWIIDFSGSGMVTESIGSTVGFRCVAPVGPAIIGPGHSLCLHYWAPGNAATAGIYEYEACWVER